MSKIYTICLKNCAFFAQHGVYEEERNSGQRFFIDIELDISYSAVLENDNLEETVDYDRVFHIIQEIVIDTRRNLIETLAMDISKALHCRFIQIKRSKVTVRKPNALVRGILDYVEATVEQFS